MAVNGIKIEVGQVWRTRGGHRVGIYDTKDDPFYPWVSRSLCYANDGTASSRTAQHDLVALTYQTVEDDHEAVTFHPLQAKLTNPKDAIGDTKLPLWLLSPIAKAQWSLCQFVGLIKYGAWNWRAAGVRTSVYLSAMQRHLDAYLSGEELDPKDGTPHLGHIMACAAILIDAKAAGKLTDDRPPSVSVRDAYAAAEAQMSVLKEQYADLTPRHYTIADTETTK